MSIYNRKGCIDKWEDIQMGAGELSTQPGLNLFTLNYELAPDNCLTNSLIADFESPKYINAFG